MRRFVSIVLAVSAVACEKSSPTAPPPTPDISGNWSGTLTSAQPGASATVTFALAQTGLIDLPPNPGLDPNQALAGTWTIYPALTVPIIVSGSLSGFINGSAVSFVFTANPSNNCPWNVTAAMTGAASMSGSYTSCSASNSGTFSATRQ